MKNLDRGGSIRVACLECGREFGAPPSRVRDGRARYCSRACLSAMKRRAYLGRTGISRPGDTNPNWRGRSAPKPCPICGDMFAAPTVTCSVHCGHALQGLKVRGSGNGNWKGEDVHLTRKYRKLIADKLAAGCEACGERRRRMVAHHRDQDRSNNTAANLVALCRSCHTTVHSLARRGELTARWRAFIV